MKRNKSFERNVGELQNIFAFIKLSMNSFGVNRDVLFEIELTAEEIFMNMIRHNKSTTMPVEISIQKNGDDLVLAFSDHELKPFDITKVKEVDFQNYIKKRKSGGLGVHIVKKYMDDVTFEHSNGISTVKLVKKIRV